MELKQGEVVLCEFLFSDGIGKKKRPVMVFKDNLPFDDFIGIPISSQPIRHNDEMKVDSTDFLLGELLKSSKLILRKTFVIHKKVILKSYGIISSEKLASIQQAFCHYFKCVPSL